MVDDVTGDLRRVDITQNDDCTAQHHVTLRLQEVRGLSTEVAEHLREAQVRFRVYLSDFRALNFTSMTP